MKFSTLSGVIAGFMLFFFCLNISVIKAQSVAFSGHVLSEAGHPLQNVHVLLNQGRYHAITNKNGAFTIHHLRPGAYRLTIQSVGYQSYSKRIEVPRHGFAHFKATLQTRLYTSDAVVVTATRTRKAIEEVPMPVTVIDKKEIDRSGSMRLSDILGEQTGLQLVANHGTGVQVQGFSSDYTLIMINGQPLIGRRAGTLDLSRVSVGNVKQIEMIKGPSSALWGSSALAGVINIITEENDRPFSLQLNSRYGTNQTLDMGAHVGWNYKDWQNTVFLNRNSSGGYRLVPNSISQTVPEYQNYTASYRTQLPLTDHIEARFYGRYYKQNQDITSFLGERENPNLLDVDADMQNYGLNPSLSIDITDRFNVNVEHFSSGFRTERTLLYQEDGSLYEKSLFDQTFNKSEAQATLRWSKQHTTTVGSGISWEQLNSKRYTNTPVLRNIFVYGQHDWNITPRLNVIGGFRYDSHSEYGSRLSPKLSAQLEITDWLHLRASAGSGFKAPAFQQLFLNFTNPTAGYSVYGSSTVVESIKALQAEGKIEKLLIPLDQLEPITAEKSWAYNAGIRLYPASNLEWSFNFFRNNVTDLIETAPIALKTNGQSAYAYFNLHKVHTQGISTQLRWEALENLQLSLGYQFLDAQRRIQDQRTVQDEEGNPIQKAVTFYGPMFNRSKHSANLKVFYTYEPLGLGANIRGTYRGRYGFADSNGNGYVDGGEYADDYMIWDAAISKTFRERYTLQLGVDNLFGFTRPQGLSYLPGRLFYAKISLQLY